MAEPGETILATAQDTLANLRKNADRLMIEMSFPAAGVDLYVGYHPECGHYVARTVRFGTDPARRENVITHETELEENEVIWRMNLLMQVDIRLDPHGHEERMMLELMMRDEEQ